MAIGSVVCRVRIIYCPPFLVFLPFPTHTCELLSDSIESYRMVLQQRYLKHVLLFSTADPVAAATQRVLKQEGTLEITLKNPSGPRKIKWMSQDYSTSLVVDKSIQPPSMIFNLSTLNCATQCAGNIEACLEMVSKKSSIVSGIFVVSKYCVLTLTLFLNY